MLFRVDASVGNAEGVFDAAYDFGDGKTEAEMSGSPEEIGRAVTRYLSGLLAEDCKAMQYGTDDFFVQLTIRPIKAATEPSN